MKGKLSHISAPLCLKHLNSHLNIYLGRGAGRGRGRGRGMHAFSDVASNISVAPSVGPQGVQPSPSRPTWDTSANPNTSVPLGDVTRRIADVSIQDSGSSSSDSSPLETFKFTSVPIPEYRMYFKYSNMFRKDVSEI